MGVLSGNWMANHESRLVKTWGIQGGFVARKICQFFGNTSGEYPVPAFAWRRSHLKYPEGHEDRDCYRGGARDWAKDGGGAGGGRVWIAADGHAGLYGNARKGKGGGG